MPSMKDQIEDFEIIPHSRNYYQVFYTSPTTGKVWSKFTDDVDLILNIKNGKALTSNLKKLKFICKL